MSRLKDLEVELVEIQTEIGNVLADVEDCKADIFCDEDVDYYEGKMAELEDKLDDLRKEERDLLEEIHHLEIEGEF